MTLPGLLVQVGLKYLFDISGKEFVGWIESRFRDSAGKVPAAVFRTNRRAWQAVALAVADDSFGSRVRDLALDADLKAARDRVRDLVPADLRPAAAGDLAALRGTATGPPTDPADVLRLYADPAGLAAAAVRAAATVADELPAAPDLALVLRLAPGGGPGLFESLFRHFLLAAAVAADPDAAARFTQSQLDGLATTLDARTAGVLDQLDILFDSLDAGFAGVNAKLDAQADQLRVIQDRLAAPRKPGVSYDTEDMRAYLLDAKAAFLRTGGAVPAEHWGRLGDALREARLYGDAGDAHTRAAATAHAARDTDTEAANHYQTYLDACEAGDWTRAAAALWAAVDLAPAHYAPFDRHRYAVQGILGGGAFGTVFHCLDRYARDEDEQHTPVAIKAFRGEKLGDDLSRVFREAGMTKLLRHDSIIGLIDQGFGDPAGQLRPYLVLEYFPGQSLDRYLAEHGPLPVADFLTVARRVAEAVHAAHSRPRPVFHRDLKPANVMVRRDPDGTWMVKVIDFGLAVRGPAIRASLNVPHALRSTGDKAVTGTIRYAPPEQLGELPGVEVGPYSDVYAYGKTCLDLLFRHTQPDDDEWNELVPEPYRASLKKLLTQCVRPALDGKFPRLRNFAPVLEALAALDPAEADARSQREEAERRAREEVVAKAVSDTQRKRPDELARAAAAAGLVGPLRDERDGRQADAERERLAWEATEDEQKRQEEVDLCTAEEEPKAADPIHPARPRAAGDKLIFRLLPADVQMTFAWCPPGTFLMGSSRTEGSIDHPDGRPWEKPAHLVTLTNGYFTGIHQVTQAQWLAVMRTDPPSIKKGPNRPVDCASWDDAREFCTKMTAPLKDRVTIRLLTEAEWEYAARAGTTTAYHFGDRINADLANYDATNTWNGSPVGKARMWTTDVGMYPANPWGLFDVHGNVWEWCQDAWDACFYKKSPERDPVFENDQADDRVKRGGCVYNHPWLCRAAFRSRGLRTRRDHGNGFRVCFSLAAPPPTTSPPSAVPPPPLRNPTAVGSRPGSQTGPS